MTKKYTDDNNKEQMDTDFNTEILREFVILVLNEKINLFFLYTN